ncbi:MFS transporter [bacterium]|nr:MFS transporter [bacterium]
MTAPSFDRDRFTLSVYGVLAVFSYGMALLGPAMPLLREDLGISRTIGGMHFSALALGSIASGLTSARLIRRFGRRTATLAGGVVLGIGGLVIALGGSPAVTIFGAYLLGHGGNIMLASMQAALSDHHGSFRAVAIGEANALSGLVFFLPGLVIAAVEWTGAGWRWAFTLPAIAWLVVFLPVRKLDVAPPHRDPEESSNRLLPGFVWTFWALTLAIAVEWSLSGWGAGYFVDEGGVTESTSAALVTLFYLSMAVGRFGGSLLSRRSDPLGMVPWSIGVATGGFLVFWAAPGVGWMIAGLIVAGLGVANLFPFITSVLFSLAPGRAETASAAVSVGGGMAVFAAPLTLGLIADGAGLAVAFSLIPVLLAAVVALSMMARRRSA